MGKSSKREEAQQALERKLQQQKAELEKQRQQNRLIRMTLLSVLAVILLIVGISVGIEAYRKANRVIDPVNSDFSTSDTTTEFVRLTVNYTDQKKVYHQGEIIVQLYPNTAPITVENFQKLVSEGFYDGLTFHRIIPGFMIQGGDPNGDGTGGTTPIKGEFSQNGVTNELLHKRGVISMARLGNDNNSASNQFFICDATKPHLDGKYASFGYVLAGMEVVDKIAAVDTGGNDKPYDNVIIEKAVFVDPLK